MSAETLGILLESGRFSRAHYAFVAAAAAASIGRVTMLFATNAGTRALAADWSGLEDAGSDAAWRARGVAGFTTLREAATALGVRCIACESGLRAADLSPDALMPGVEVSGIVTFLQATRGGQIITL